MQGNVACGGWPLGAELPEPPRPPFQRPGLTLRYAPPLEPGNGDSCTWQAASVGKFTAALPVASSTGETAAGLGQSGGVLS